MKNLIKAFAKDETGANAIEYALIAVLIAVAIIAALNAVTGGLNGAFGRVVTGLS